MDLAQLNSGTPETKPAYSLVEMAETLKVIVAKMEEMECKNVQFEQIQDKLDTILSLLHLREEDEISIHIEPEEPTLCETCGRDIETVLDAKGFGGSSSGPLGICCLQCGYESLEKPSLEELKQVITKEETVLESLCFPNSSQPILPSKTEGHHSSGVFRCRSKKCLHIKPSPEEWVKTDPYAQAGYRYAIDVKEGFTGSFDEWKKDTRFNVVRYPITEEQYHEDQDEIDALREELENEDSNPEVNAIAKGEDPLCAITKVDCTWTTST